MADVFMMSEFFFRKLLKSLPNSQPTYENDKRICVINISYKKKKKLYEKVKSFRFYVKLYEIIIFKAYF